MYQSASLGFSLPRWLTPPRSVRELAAGIVGAVVRGTTITIPTPVGPQTFNLGDPSQRAQLEAMVRGTRVNVATPEPGGGGFDINRTVQSNVPGGWATIAMVGVAAALVLPRLLRRRRY